VLSLSGSTAYSQTQDQSQEGKGSATDVFLRGEATVIRDPSLRPGEVPPETTPVNFLGLGSDHWKGSDRPPPVSSSENKLLREADEFIRAGDKFSRHYLLEKAGDAYRSADAILARTGPLPQDVQPDDVSSRRKYIARALAYLDSMEAWLGVRDPGAPGDEVPFKVMCFKERISLAIAMGVASLVTAIILRILHTTAVFKIMRRGKGVPPEWKYRTFTARVEAWCIDAVVMLPVILCVDFIRAKSTSWLLLGILDLILLVAYWGYRAGMHAKYGQTVGKMVSRVKIVQASNEGPVSTKQAVARECFTMLIVGVVACVGEIVVMWAIKTQTWSVWTFVIICMLVGSFLPVIWRSVDALFAAFGKRRRALHDILAGTIVLRTQVFAEADQMVTKVFHQETAETGAYDY